MNLFLFLCLYAIFCAGLVHVFKSMDLASWLAFVPGLNLYLLVKNTWGSVYFWILALLVGNCLILPHMYTMNGHPLMLTAICMEVLTSMVWLMICLHVAVSFGKGALYGTLLALVPFIGIWMIPARFEGIVPSLSNTNHREAAVHQDWIL